MSAKDNDWKSRLGMVYSTNPDFAFDSGEEKEADTPPKNRQKLRVGIERKNRGGKVVTVVKGFVGAEAALKELGRMLKTKCGVGGAVKDGEIIIQGEWKQRIVELLGADGYPAVFLLIMALINIYLHIPTLLSRCTFE